MNASLQNLPPMVLALQANFGSVERWRSEFAAMCRAQRAPAGRARLESGGPLEAKQGAAAPALTPASPSDNARPRSG